MFSLFKKSESTVEYQDRVWKTGEASLKGMLMMAMMKIQAKESCVIICYFESEVDRVAKFLTNHQLDYQVLSEENAYELKNGSILLILAKSLQKSNVTDSLTKNLSSISRQVLFSGHYPKIEAEGKTLQVLQATGFTDFTFCLSFEDPLLKIFVSDRLIGLLEKLGIEEEEAIEHAMVTKSIMNARKKVDEKVKQEVETKSPEEWFYLNVEKKI